MAIKREIKTFRPTSKQEELRVKLDLHVDILDDIIRYLYSENPTIRKATILGIRQLLQILDLEYYEDNYNLSLRIFTIDKFVDAYLDLGLRHSSLLTTIGEGSYSDDIFELLEDLFDPTSIDSNEVSDEFINGIDRFISDRLQYSHLFRQSDLVIGKFIDLKKGNFTSLEELNEEMEVHIGGLLRDIQSAKMISQQSQLDFSVDGNSFRNVCSEAIAQRKMPSNIIKMGVKGLNTFLGGGYESGRVYLHLSNQGGWKSGYLLNIATAYKNFNADIKANDPTKKSCCLYLSLENDQFETLERLYSIVVPVDDQKEFNEIEDENEVVEQFAENGWDIDNTETNVHFLYRQSKSLSTTDLTGVLDNLSFTGYECKMLIIDYAKRIRPAVPCGDIRIELGDIMDELSVLAKQRRIPIVTAMQINRVGLDVIERALETNKSNIVKSLGGSNIGESSLMLDNADAVFVNYREYRELDETLYLTMKTIKHRSKKKSSIGQIICMPFIKDSEMQLQHDLNTDRDISLYDLSDGLASMSSGKGANIDRSEILKKLKSSKSTSYTNEVNGETDNEPE